MTNINTYGSIISQLESIDANWREQVKYIITKSAPGVDDNRRTRIYNVKNNHDALIRTIADQAHFQIEKIENGKLICCEVSMQ